MDKIRDFIKKNPYIAIVVLILIITLACMGVLAWNNYRENSGAIALEKVQKQVNDVPAATEETEAETPAKTYAIPAKNLNWDELHEINPDIYAWIYVPDAEGVDFPVVQHPTDDLYYLEHNIDYTEGYPGCIYTEHTYNSKDFHDNHTVIYGHNMKDGSMFGALHTFETANLDDEHLIYIYTEDKVFVYEIYAAYDYPSIHLLANLDTSDDDIYSQYLDIAQQTAIDGHPSNWSTTKLPTRDDDILTLSTCLVGGDDNFRFLVQGVLREEVSL